MNQEDCTCGERTCYACRRQEIDATALRIVDREIVYCTGMWSKFDVQAHAWRMADQYRCQAINKLAFELEF